MAERNTATKVGEVAHRYIAIWNEPDAGARCRAVAELWTEDGTYTDPLASARGRQAIAEVITDARQQFTGYVFELNGNVDAHHDIVRFGWDLVPVSGGEPVVIGLDVAVVAEDGRLRSVYGFLDKVPAA